MAVKEHVLTKYRISPSKSYCLIPRRIRGGMLLFGSTREKNNLKRKREELLTQKPTAG